MATLRLGLLNFHVVCVGEVGEALQRLLSEDEYIKENVQPYVSGELLWNYSADVSDAFVDCASKDLCEAEHTKLKEPRASELLTKSIIVSESRPNRIL